jgi:hypothetical protein
MAEADTLKTDRGVDAPERITDLFWGATGVQIFGVTAALVGFLGLRFDERVGLVALLPVLAAYLAIVVVWYQQRRVRNIQEALKCVYRWYITWDVVCLGALVLLSGGTRKSIFFPLFLLIPATASCYCRPTFDGIKSFKGWFWGNIVLVAAVLALITGINLVVDLEKWSGASASAARATGIWPTPWAELITVLCILAAGFCHQHTSALRRKRCREMGGERLVCDGLYLAEEPDSTGEAPPP